MPLDPADFCKIKDGLPIKVVPRLDDVRKETYCKVCLADGRNCQYTRKELEELYIAKTMSAKEIGKVLGIDVRAVKAHFDGHYRSDTAKALARVSNAEHEALETFQEFRYVKVLTEKVFDRSMDLLESDNANPRDIKALVSEVRQLAKLIAEIEQHIQPASRVQVNQVIHNYNDLKEAVFSQLCYDCRMKVLNAMSSTDDAMDVEAEVA